MPESACRTCRRLTKGSVCPVCKSAELTRTWRSVLVVFNPEAEIAKAAGISSPGKFAVRVK